MYLLACVILISGGGGGLPPSGGGGWGGGLPTGVWADPPPGLPTGGDLHPGGWADSPPPPRYMGYGQQASCTHPTGMLSCSILCSVQIVNECLHCVKSFVNISHAIGLNKELNKIFK